MKINKGQILLEVVIAIGIATIGLVGVVALMVTTQRNTNYNKNSTLGTRYAQELTEWFRGQKDSNWQQFYTNTGISPQCFRDLSWPLVSGTCSESQTIGDSVFTREATFARPSANEVNVTIEVNWTDGQGEHNVRNYTTFTNWAAN